MRYWIAALIVLPVLAGAAHAASPSGDGFDWNPWRHLAVQDGGRRKPLDTLAWETLRTLSNRARIADPETGEKLSSTAFYLAMLFDWQAADRASSAHAPHGMCPQDAYSAGRAADKWDRAPLLRVDYLALREALGMKGDQKYIPPLELSQARIRIPGSDRQWPFVVWAEQLAGNQSQGYTVFEKKALELADKLWSYQQHRMGKRLQVVPVPGSQHQDWLSVAQLMGSTYNDKTDPSGDLRKAQEEFTKARAAYEAGSPEAFNEASAAFLAAVREVGPTLGAYPEQATIDLEVAYNHWAPFRIAWMLTLTAFLVLLLGMGSHWKPFYLLGLATYVAGIVAMLAGFAMRIGISGRAPVTDMYESVIYLALGTAVLGLVLELFHRKQFILAAAAAVSTVALVLADNCPATLDSSLRPLQPVLRSNFWLVTHVMTITLSYAAFALALGVGNITLGYFLVRSRNEDLIAALSKFTHRALQFGVLLLAIGTLLGGVWADYSWGRFWGWDPKEVWALIALVVYLAVLHARYVNWVGHFGLAALSVICFSMVLMAWYGVNYLGAGLHSYGFGVGGQWYVLGGVMLQFLYVGVVVARHFSSPTPVRQPDPAEPAGAAGPRPRVKSARPERVAP